MGRSGIQLGEAERRELRELEASSDPRIVTRARIVLALDEGLKVDEVVRRVGTNKNSVTKWKKRYLEGGAEALRSSLGGGPAPADGIVDLQARIMEILDTKRDIRWNRKLLAGELGVTEARVGRELGRMGITLTRATRWSIPAPTGAAARTACLAGLFLSASERCLVVCVSDGALDVGEGAVGNLDLDAQEAFRTTLPVDAHKAELAGVTQVREAQAVQGLRRDLELGVPGLARLESADAAHDPVGGEGRRRAVGCARVLGA